MGRVKDELLFLMIRNYLTVYLPVQRKASSNTITAYRTSLNQFLNYVAAIKNISVLAVTFDMFNYEYVNGFLDMLSSDRNLSSATRNNRLAAIKAFIIYASACRPEYISLCSELSAIKVQKQDRFAKIDYMSEAAVKALLEAPDLSSDKGVRDRFMMIFLYDTGARIQEFLNIKLCDIKLNDTPTVKLFGKGRKTRIVPLMQNTVQHLRNYLDKFHNGSPLQSEEFLFYVERRGKRYPMSDDNVRLRLQKYADEARVNCPEVPEKVYPHLWRHTRAMHLYQHGMDLTLVSQWLCHANIQTTLVYAYADTEAKRRAIEKAMSGPQVQEETPEKKVRELDEDTIRRLYGL